MLFRLWWLFAAVRTKRQAIGAREIVLLVVVIAVVIVLSHFVPEDLDVHSQSLIILGAAITASGMAFAIWARIHLGDSWGLPMTWQEEAPLVTSGPYRLVRHPIYAGVFVALLGTGIAVNLIILALAVCAAIFMIASARIEERNLQDAFPEAYPLYASGTRMLLPFVL